jgi:hypothetical protein
MVITSMIGLIQSGVPAIPLLLAVQRAAWVPALIFSILLGDIYVANYDERRSIIAVVNNLYMKWFGK